MESAEPQHPDTEPTPADSEAARVAEAEASPETQEQPEPGAPEESRPAWATNEEAPDADTPGDEEVPEELQKHVEDGEVPKDEVDQAG